MTQPQIEPPSRDAARSRDAILIAATELFCAKGFHATSIGDIATLAGLARGTPSYFFGSKEELYKAVLEHVLKSAYEIVPNALEKAGADRSPSRLIEVFTDAYMDYHHHHPAFLKMIHWIALEGNRLMNEVQAHWGTVSAMLQAVMMTLEGTPLERDDQRQMVLSIIGMCNAHLMYGQSVAEPLGLEPSSSDFLEARKAHIKKILGAVIGSPTKE